MNEYKEGERLNLILKGLFGRSTVTAYVKKKCWFMYLVEWSVHDVDDDYIYYKAAWKPVWRLYR